MTQTIIVHDQFFDGAQSKLGVNAAALIVPARARLGKIMIVTPGSAGNLVLNDVATLAGAGAGNLVETLAFGNALIAAAGAIWNVGFPFQKGIVISAIPTGMVLNISWG